jgi:hypothetical protein
MNEQEMLLFSVMTFVWVIGAYGVQSYTTLFVTNSTRLSKSRFWATALITGLAAGLIVLVLNARALWLATFVLAAAAVVGLLRRICTAQYAAELDVLAISGALGGMFLIIRSGGLVVTRQLFKIPATSKHICAVLLIFSIAIYLCKGGTVIVRGLLSKAGTLPRLGGTPSHEDPLPEDTAELNRGRLIGNIERLVLALVVAAGSYEALGFLVAAKGFIRSDNFKDRNLAEYFIVGTLGSVLVAIIAGMLIRLIFQRLLAS